LRAYCNNNHNLRHDKNNFNIAVPERVPYMESIFKGKIPVASNSREFAQAIATRYQDIDELFNTEISEQTIPFFCDGLIDNVHLVEISALTDANAYTIFVTMNYRGLSLKPLDMLKG